MPRSLGSTAMPGLVAAFLALFSLAGAAGAAPVTSDVEVEMWGRAVFNVHYDTALQSQEFMSFLTDEDEEELNFNPREARVGFAASERGGEWTYRAVVEFDFYGDNAGNNLLPRLRLGYAEARGDGWSVRGGQDWVPIAQLHPGTLDFGCLSWAGNLWHRTPQLTVRREQGEWEMLAGTLAHRISSDQEQQELMPWVVGRVAAHDLVGPGSLLALGAGYRAVTVDDHDYTPWLVAAELTFPFGESGLALTAEAYVGRAVGREFVHYGFDYNPQHPDGPTGIASVGGFASLQARVIPEVELNAGLGIDDPDDADMRVAERGEPDVPYETTMGAYRTNTVVFGNVKHHVTHRFGWGAEVAHFATDTDEAELTGQRFTSSIWFKF